MRISKVEILELMLIVIIALKVQDVVLDMGIGFFRSLLYSLNLVVFWIILNLLKISRTKTKYYLSEIERYEKENLV